MSDNDQEGQGDEFWTALYVLNSPQYSPEVKIGTVLRDGLVGDRVARLFAVWCTRQALVEVGEIDPRTLLAVETAERYAMGTASYTDLVNAGEGAHNAFNDLWNSGDSNLLHLHSISAAALDCCTPSSTWAARKVFRRLTDDFTLAAEQQGRVNYLVKLLKEYSDTEAQPITLDGLSQYGFQKIHMNPAWNGGYMSYIKDVPRLHDVSIRVTFGDHYCLDANVEFIVWFVAGSFGGTSVPMIHIKTIEQLRQLWLAVSGESLEMAEEPAE